MGKLVTTTELAGILDVSRTTLAKAIAAGRLTVAERDARGRPLFDSSVAVKEWAEWAGASARKSRHKEGKSRGGRPTDVDTAEVEASLTSEGIDFAALFGDGEGLTPAQKQQRADLLNTILSAKQKDIKIRQEEGRLISRETASDQLAELGMILVNQYAALVARLSPQLATMTDVYEIDEFLGREFNVTIKLIRRDCGVPEDSASEGKEVPKE